MNVNSRGHNLDTKKSQYFLEIKHPPEVKIPVGVFTSSDRRKNNPKVQSFREVTHDELTRGYYRNALIAGFP